MLTNDEMLVCGAGFVSKLNNQGHKIWIQYGMTGSYDIAAHTNGYLVLGHNGLIKIDTSGAILWQREYPNVDYLSKVVVLPDNSLMMIGNNYTTTTIRLSSKPTPQVTTKV